MLCGAFHQSFVCKLGGDGEDEKRSPPHSHSVREAGRRLREEVCACVREREREREKRSTRG